MKFRVTIEAIVEVDVNEEHAEGAEADLDDQVSDVSAQVGQIFGTNTVTADVERVG